MSNMNKTTKTVALFSVLSLMAVGCQKENVADFTSGAYTSEADSMYHVHYTIDGVTCQATFHSKVERTEFFRHLLAMARNGHEVVFYSGSKTTQYFATKDVVYYSTSEEKDALAWMEEMHEGGYKVSVKFDAEKKVYNCVAWK